MFSRFAIYYTPEPDSDLAKFGASWLGWDSVAGRQVAHPTVASIDIEALTRTPRKYGFHATIKPPLRLAAGKTADELAGHLEALCATAKPVQLDGLAVTRLGKFLALCPVGDTGPLAYLAARFVKELDAFRAAPNEAELAKRRAARLTAAQEALLLEWGYPYVLDEFRFHMTLSGRLDAELADRAEAALAEQLAHVSLAPHDIATMTLLGEAADGKFHQIHRYALTG